jgi:pilus assembly protein CpaF
MTPHSRSPDRRGVGYPPRTGNGLAGSVHTGIDGSPEVGMAGGSNGTGGAGLRDVGTVGPAGTGAAGSSIDLGLPAGRSRPSATGLELPAGSSRSGATGIGPTAANTGPGVIGGVPPGLIQRVQRHLAAAGAVAADSAGLQTAVTEALREDGILLPAANLAPIVRAIGDELTGLGPLAPLLADPTVTDVLVNGPTDVWVERAGSIERAAVRFASAAAVAAMVQRVVAPLGLRVDESRPWVDARLPGGERFHAVLPPLAPDGPVVTIRTFARRRLQLGDLIDRGALDVTTARLLEAMVAAGIAIAVSGATGTGKTTLLNVLAAAIPARERVVTIEDVAELSLPGPHVVRLEARPPNVEGRGEVPLRELVRNALRMRPDRIVVGEVRGPEVLDMLQAANTGHRGLMTTLHAGGPDEVPARLEAMALTAPGAGLDVVRRLVSGGIGAVVHLERAPTGHPTRRVTAIAELVTTDDGPPRAIPLRTATSNTELSATGHVPHWASHLDPRVLPAFEPTHLAGRVRVLCPRSPIR